MELHASKKTAILLFTFFFLIQFSLLAQNSILHRKISIYAENKKLDELLDIISKKGRFYFSYNSSIIDKNKTIQKINEKNVSIKSLLDKVLGDEIEPVETGKYIILRLIAKKNNQEEIKIPEQKTRYIITGYITNSKTGERLTNSTVYEIGKTNSVLTDLNGHYRLSISTKNDNLGLAYSRRNFKDTVIVIQPADHTINMRLVPKEKLPEQIENKGLPQITHNPDTISRLEGLPLVKFAVKKRQFNLSKNLDFIEKQHFQVSLIPQFGTNRLMSGNVENNISLNILGGYSYALKGAEFGALLNIERENAYGVQISGFGNIVGGNTKGLQLAGFMNNNRRSVKGVQISGFSNIVLDTITGVQLSGFSNVLKGRMNGLQLAGFSNVTTENVDGVQVSGFSNFARKDVRFAQVSGFANYGENVGGVQLTGFINAGNDIGGAQIAGFMNFSTGTVGGAQIAGVINISKQVNSAQAAGLINISTQEITGLQVSTFNFAKKVVGAQLGVINVADSVSGLSIGFLSFVRQGIHKIELSLVENNYAYFSFKTGTHRFYNILTIGSRLDNNDYYSVGYGVGTELRSKKSFYFDFDIIAGYVYENFEDTEDLIINGYLKCNTLFGWKIFRSSGFSIGPSMNFFLSNWTDIEGNFLSRYAPYELFSITQNDFKISGWVGATATIRF